jgi:sugar phosphate isomerase/epimerase
VRNELRLTYCGNVHAANDLDGWLATLARFVAPIAAGRPRPFGLGVWWPAEVAGELHRSAAARDRVRSALAAHGFEIWTLNVFPHGRFHGAPVKAAVYAPDWSHEDRLQYTRDAAEAAAALARPGAMLPLSTLPVGFGHPDLRLCARNLARAASMLADLEARTGVRCVLALEPEPCCVVESIAGAIRFCEEWLLRAGAWTVPEPVLRRHLGVCADLCHLAVVREDPAGAFAALRAAGIELAKVQVSSCLELRDPRALDELLAWNEPVYLHQTIADSGRRALDLPEVAAWRGALAAGERLRTHFHVPIAWDAPGALGSTRAALESALAALPRPLPLLEVETYTWDVLPDRPAGDAALVAGIRAELDFAAARIPS